MKIDAEVAEMVREHVAANGIGPGQLIFPVRLFAARTMAARRERISEEEMEVLGSPTRCRMASSTNTARWAPTSPLSAGAGMHAVER